MNQSYDNLCLQLNENKSNYNNIKLELENTKESNQLFVEKIKREFQREIKNLQKIMKN